MKRRPGPHGFSFEHGIACMDVCLSFGEMTYAAVGNSFDNSSHHDLYSYPINSMIHANYL